jgi:hypothetical protein
VEPMDPTFETSVSFFEAHAIPDSQFAEIDLSTELTMTIKRSFMFLLSLMFCLSF